MDYEKAKLRTDLDELKAQTDRAITALAARLEPFEAKAAAEAKAEAEAKARAEAEAKTKRKLFASGPKTA